MKILQYQDIFPDELPIFPLDKENVFMIDLVREMKPVFKAPRRMAPDKMKKLPEQTHEMIKRKSNWT
ncbi:MAG: hypothetical protein Q8832_02455 [Candidatus Phytoplasma australasiaticum]|nr:hypothetical protein [Candidatus Phytoplasma australasiaticum]